jgi:hypothetical protein
MVLHTDQKGAARWPLPRHAQACAISHLDLYNGKGVRDPAREKLIQTRKTLVGQWMTAADILAKHGETTLARKVRNFAGQLQTVLTDREKLTVDYVLHHQRATNKVPIGPNGQRRQRDDLTR